MDVALGEAGTLAMAQSNILLQKLISDRYSVFKRIIPKKRRGINISHIATCDGAIIVQ